ncbi:MAG TPA: DUF4837 family protein [Melioribacteraceae bacterium]|nr:DUF4837 family protein [Melioribacteraceae bacterium]
MIKKSLLFFVSVLVIISIMISFSACSQKKKAFGNEDDIYVISDTASYYALEPALLTVFNKIVYTPQPENLFNLKRFNYDSFEKQKNKKNVLIICPLYTGSELSKYVESILDDKVIDLVMKDSAFFFTKKDLWAKDQLVMIVTGKSDEVIAKNLLQYSENLLYAFQKASDERLFNSLYNPKYEKKDIEAKLLKDYGWLIYVQADFQLAMNKPKENFVWLRRSPDTDMERWIFVHWIDNADPLLLNGDSILSIRNKVTEKYYRTADDSTWVEISEDNRSSKEVNFNGYYAIMTQGLWRFKDNSGGGPFISYTFYDEKSKRLYMIDGSIYAPKYYKKRLIHQIDVLLQSFKPGHKVDKDKAEDILSYYE